MDSIQVIYEDNHLIAVNKPSGVLVQGDETGDTPLSEYVKEYIKVRYNKPGAVFLGVIHRLDRPASGAVIFARTSKALGRMNKLFQQREIKKTYFALTEQRPAPLSGRLTHYIAKDRRHNVAKVFTSLSNRAKEMKAKKAVLEYEMIGELENNVLLKVDLETGRSHQIRAQLAEMGCPIRGDLKYGFGQANPDASIHLHCRNMSFIHPVKKASVTVEAELPDDPVWDLFRQVAG